MSLPPPPHPPCCVIDAGGDFSGIRDDGDFYTKHYSPDSASLQFVFRGEDIFKGAIEDLLSKRLGEAEDVVLAGSSAGKLDCYV